MQEKTFKPFLYMDIAIPYMVQWEQVNTHSIECRVFNNMLSEEERRVAQGIAICSKPDANKGMYSQEYGLWLSLKRAMKDAKSEGIVANKMDRKLIFDAFFAMVKASKTITPTKVTPKPPKFPSALEGQEFLYKGKRYLVVGKVWGKAPKARYHKVMGGKSLKPWVEYVIYEDYQGERYTRPLSEFTSKFIPA